SFAVELVQVFPFPKSSLANLKVFVSAIDRERVGSIGLQLNGVRAGFFCGTNEFHRIVKSLPVVRGHFGDNVSRLTLADHAVFYGYGLHFISSHAVFRQSQRRPWPNSPMGGSCSAS